MNFKNYLSNKTWDSPPHSPRTQHQTQDHEASIEDVLQNFYNKVFQIILQHRITHPNYTQTKNISGLQRRLSLNKRPNRWFSLELDDIDLYRNDTRPWRQAILREEVVPPLILEIYLDCSQLNSNQVTYLVDSGTKKFQLDLGKNNSNTYNAEATENDNLKDSILIEQWCLRLNKDRIDSNSDSISFYKQSIAFFKSFDTYIRLLPAYRLFNRLKSTKTKGLRVGYRFLYQTTNHSNEIGIDNIPKEYQNILECTQNHFQSLTTSQGTLELFLISRKKCDFFVEDGENYLSTCFQNDDQVQDDSRQQKPQQSSVNDRTASPLSYASNSTGSYPSISQQEPRIGSQGSTHSRISNPSQNFATPTPIPSQRFNMPDAIPSQGSESSLTRFLANEKQVGSVGSFKASPPSYLTMHTRRSPSGNIGSPSLSSSPSSTHNQPSSFKSYSTDYKGSPHPMQFNIPRASPASGFRAESPLPSSKLSSSFGIKFPIINEYADSGYQKSSNSGKLIMGRESYESKPRHPRRGSGGSSYDLSTQEDDISELVKAIDNRKPLRLFGESSISVDLSRSQTMLDQFQNLQSDLCALNFTTSSKSQEPVNNVIAPEEPVLEDNDTITSPLKIPTPSQKHLFLAGSPLPSSFNVSRIHNEHGNSKSTSKSVPSDQLHHPRMRSNDTIPLTVTPDTQYEEERNQTIQDDNMLFDMSELNIS